MAELVAKDARTTTACNMAYLTSLTGLDCVPDKESWRLGLLDILLQERGVLEKEGGDTKRVISMISSLCST